MKKIFIFLFIFPSFLQAQNVGIGTTTPSEKLEIKNAIRSTVKISANGFSDTTELVLSNRNNSNQGTSFLLKNIREEGLFISSSSDLPENTSPNSLIVRPNGNIGINSPAPLEKLDVNGNINVTGTIKANGVDGAAGQVLMKSTSGNLIWGDYASEFKNFTSFQNAGTGFTWIVPAGVTKIFAEAWGGGGGGNNIGGGGGGGYGCAIMNVTPGETITINVGQYGIGNTSLEAGDGTESRVSRGSPAIYFFASGGRGAYTNQAGDGGEYSTNAGSLLISYMGRKGSSGTVTQEKFMESAPGTFLKSFNYGDGGNSGNTAGTGGKGGYRLINAATSVQISNYIAAFTSSPGGGGAGGVNGLDGAKGLVIIHY